MTTNIIGRVICKIAAVYFVVQGARGITYVVPIAFEATTSFGVFLISLFATVGAPLILAFLLWKYADQIAATDDAASPQNISTEVTKEDLLEVGLVLIGTVAILFGIANAIPIEFSDLWLRLSQDYDNSYLDEALIHNWGERLGYITQIVLGFLLIYGKKSVLGYIRRARRAGASGP